MENALLEEVAASLVREFLSKKGLKKTSSTMDEEFPRTALSINNRNELRNILHLQSLYKMNKDLNLDQKGSGFIWLLLLVGGLLLLAAYIHWLMARYKRPIEQAHATAPAADLAPALPPILALAPASEASTSGLGSGGHRVPVDPEAIQSCPKNSRSEEEKAAAVYIIKHIMEWSEDQEEGAELSKTIIRRPGRKGDK